jgi:hypothetical protein
VKELSMPLIADKEHSTISPRRVQPMWIVLAVVAVLGLVIVTRFTPDPATVERVTIRNDTEFDLGVDAAAADHDGWTPVGIALARSEGSFEDIVDHGDEWVFRFRGQGRDGGEIQVTRAELEASDWVLRVPSSVGDRIRSTGAPASPAQRSP